MEKIAIVDDHPLFRAGVKEFLSKSAEFEVVFEGGSRRELEDFLRQQHYQASELLFVLDISLPDCNGFELLPLIRQAGGKTERCVMLSMHAEREYAEHAFELGAFGYVIKNHDTNVLIESLRSVARGERYASDDLQAAVSPALDQHLIKVDDPVIVGSTSNNSLADLDSLTKRERAVLKLVAEEKTSKEISEVLFLSPRTVENHRARICAKLNVSGSHGLIAYALKNQSIIKNL